MNKDIISRFAFHKPDSLGIARMRAIRIKVRELSALIHALCPESREKETAFTQLATVMMHANSAIVQSYPVDPSDLTEEEQKLFEPAPGETL